MASNPERERRIRECLTEVMRSHRDPKDADYNQCDDDPCMWCDNAQKVLDSAPSEQEAQPDLSGFSDADLHNELLEREQRRYAEGTVLAAAREAQPQATKADALAELRKARAHMTAVQERGHSQYIKENGRHGGSPWAELLEAIDAACALSESQPASPAADTELADMRELYEQTKNDPRREILTDFAAWLTTQPGTLHVGASHSSPAVLEVALRYMVERAADTEEGQTERIEIAGTVSDVDCVRHTIALYVDSGLPGGFWKKGRAPIGDRATLLVHRERCTDSQSGGSEPE